MEVIVGIVCAGLALGVVAGISLGMGLLSLSVEQPVIMTLVTVALYAGVLWWTVRTIRRPNNSPALMGALIGCILGCLGGGLCATMIAINSAHGLNIH